MRAGCLVCVGLLQAVTATGQAAPETWTYVAPGACPKQSEFVGRVAARRAARDARKIVSGSRVSVELQRSGVGFSGRIKLSSRSAEVTRQIQASDCDELASAAALVVALALDAQVEPKGQPPAPASPTQAELTPLPRSASLLPRPQRSKPPPVALALGAAADADFALAPVVALGLSGALVLEAPAGESILRVQFGYRAAEFERLGGAIRSELWSTRFEPCPFRAALAKGLSLVPCVALEVGHLRVKPSGAGFEGAPEGLSQIWFSGFIVPRFELRAGQRLVLEVAPQIQLPLNQETTIEADVVAGEERRREVLHRTEFIDFALSVGGRVAFF